MSLETFSTKKSHVCFQSYEPMARVFADPSLVQDKHFTKRISLSVDVPPQDKNTNGNSGAQKIKVKYVKGKVIGESLGSCPIKL